MNRSETKKVWRKFIVFALFLVFIPISYLLYGSYFNKFGKKYEEMDRVFYYIDIAYLLISAVSLYLFYKFLGKNWDKIEKPKLGKNRGKR